MEAVIAGVSFDEKQRWLQKGDECRHLEPKVFSLLTALLSANGALVTRDELIKQVWQGRIVGEGAINRTVSLLRGHFSALGCENVIETVPTQGYRLTAEVIYPEAADTAPADMNKAVTADGENILPESHHPAGTNKVKFISGLGTLILIISLLLWLLLTKFSEQQLQPLIGEPVISLEGWEYFVSATADGELILYHHRDKDNQVKVYLYDSRSHESRLLLQDVQATLSPDGTKVAYLSKERAAKEKAGPEQSTTNDACFVRLYTLATKETQTLFQCRKWPSRLAWGADNQLYYNQRSSKSYPYQVFSFDINTRAIRQISMPKGHSNLKGDFDFTYNPLTGQLAVLRYKNEQETELLLFAGEQNRHSEPVVHALPLRVTALAWQAHKAQLLLVSGEGIYTFAPESERLTLAGQIGKKINSLAVINHLGQEQILVSETRAASEIFRYDINVGSQTLWQTSSRLELLPRIVDETAALLSTRYKSHHLWLVEENKASLLEVDLPFELEFSRYEFSADGKKILLSKFGAVFEIDIEKQSYSRLLPESTQAYVVNYGDNNDVIYSSTRSGQWQLWQYRRDSGKHRQLTVRGGYSGRVKDGALYFTKFNQGGLWRKPLDGQGALESGEEQLVIEDFPLINWLNWQLLADRVYFYRPASGIWQYQLTEQQETLVMAKPDNFVHQFAVSPDHKQLYWVKQKPVAGDIYRYSFLESH
ncbi:winged helix-turn-helix domain-containing protein [Thalassomonas viridans]|uniref:Winged helix-turn-helix domain-containing protein n=1 Tax=Thalassomonas viridans TaxID=137584 RepID=A0AAE9Z4P6_9GAMM|nr:winged helix-turn-helix domain-containing protein [Thalassomonas viridans]WDE06711.1 winged helix-turn-helix domain-containing protein [Thalassomonas viridans]